MTRPALFPKPAAPSLRGGDSSRQAPCLAGFLLLDHAPRLAARAAQREAIAIGARLLVMVAGVALVLALLWPAAAIANGAPRSSGLVLFACLLSGPVFVGLAVVIGAGYQWLREAVAFAQRDGAQG